MTVNEAKQALHDKYSALVPISCTEYLSCYVFEMRPEGSEGVEKVMDMLLSVDKKNGEIKGFQPFMMPFTEYQNGRKVIV